MKNLHSLFNIEIPDTDPFQNDVLGRKTFAEALLNVIKTFNGGIVIGLNGRWGTGKTTFIKMFDKWLKSSEQNNVFCTATINAWEHEYFNDPTLAMLSCINSLLPEENENFVEAATKIEEIKQTLPILAKNGLRNIISKLSFGIISSDDLKEAEVRCKEITETNYKYKLSSIDEYREEIAGFRLFKECVSDYFNYLSEVSQNPVIIFIDEIDRCNPSYAVALLERIKHLFSTENTVFILSIDKEQLEHSICGYYGSEHISSEEYLRRFIDIEISMPINNIEKFSKNVISKLGLLQNEFLSGNYWETLSDAIDLVSSYKKLTLRQIEKLLILSLLSFQKSRPDYLSFYITIPLSFIKCFYPKQFASIYKKEMNMSELHDFLKPIYMQIGKERPDYFLTFMCLYQDYCAEHGQFKEGFNCYDENLKYIFDDTYTKKDENYAFHQRSQWSLDYVIRGINLYDDLINL